MSFELNHSGSLRQQIRRKASQRLDTAVKALRRDSDSVGSRDAGVHNARKHLKEVRALLRLVREGLGKKKFDRENKALRDAARPLSEVRDATALIEALDSLEERYTGTVNQNAFKSVRDALARRRALLRQRFLLQGRTLEKSAVIVKKARNRADQWELPRAARGVLQSGLCRTYSLGRQSMAAASQKGSDENLHEWRKRTKDLRYQLELLEPLWPERMKVTAEQAKTLTDLLGDDHDLAVMRGLLGSELKEAVTGEDAETLQGLIDGRRAELQHSAAALSEKLFAESPEQFVERLKNYGKTT